MPIFKPYIEASVFGSSKLSGSVPPLLIHKHDNYVNSFIFYSKASNIQIENSSHSISVNLSGLSKSVVEKRPKPGKAVANTPTRWFESKEIQVEGKMRRFLSHVTMDYFT